MFLNVCTQALAYLCLCLNFIQTSIFLAFSMATLIILCLANALNQVYDELNLLKAVLRDGLLDTRAIDHQLRQTKTCMTVGEGFPSEYNCNISNKRREGVLRVGSKHNSLTIFDSPPRSLKATRSIDNMPVSFKISSNAELKRSSCPNFDILRDSLSKKNETMHVLQYEIQKAMTMPEKDTIIRNQECKTVEKDKSCIRRSIELKKFPIMHNLKGNMEMMASLQAKVSELETKSKIQQEKYIEKIIGLQVELKRSQKEIEETADAQTLATEHLFISEKLFIIKKQQMEQEIKTLLATRIQISEDNRMLAAQVDKTELNLRMCQNDLLRAKKSYTKMHGVVEENKILNFIVRDTSDKATILENESTDLKRQVDILEQDKYILELRLNDTNAKNLLACYRNDQINMEKMSFLQAELNELKVKSKIQQGKDLEMICLQEYLNRSQEKIEYLTKKISKNADAQTVATEHSFISEKLFVAEKQQFEYEIKLLLASRNQMAEDQKILATQVDETKSNLRACRNDLVRAENSYTVLDIKLQDVTQENKVLNIKVRDTSHRTFFLENESNYWKRKIDDFEEDKCKLELSLNDVNTKNLLSCDENARLRNETMLMKISLDALTSKVSDTNEARLFAIEHALISEKLLCIDIANQGIITYDFDTALSEKTAELQSCRSDKEYYKNLNTDLSKQLEISSKENESFDVKVKDSLERIISFEKKSIELNKRLSEHEKDKDASLNMLKEVITEKEKALRNAECLTSEREKLVKHGAMMQKNINELDQNRKRLESDLQDAKETVLRFSDDNVEVQNHFNSMKTSLDFLTSKIDIHEKRSVATECCFISEKLLNMEMEDKIKHMLASQNEMAKNNETSFLKINYLDKALNEITTELQSCRSDKIQFEHLNVKLSNKVNSVLTENEKFKIKINDMGVKAAKLKNEFMELKQKSSGCERVLEKVLADNETLLKENKELNQKSDELNQEKNENMLKEQNKTKNESMFADLNENVRELYNEKNCLSTEITTAKRKLAELENGFSILKEQFTACEYNKNTLLQTFEQLNNLKEALECEISALRKNKDKFETKYKQDTSINALQIEIIESNASIELATNAALEEAWVYASERDQATRRSTDKLKGLEVRPRLVNQLCYRS